MEHEQKSSKNSGKESAVYKMRNELMETLAKRGKVESRPEFEGTGAPEPDYNLPTSKVRPKKGLRRKKK